MRPARPSVFPLASLAVLGLALPGTAAAQAQVLDIVNAGKPAPDVAVVVASEEGEEEVGRTDAAGQASFPLSILNMGKGTRVEVYVRQCAAGEVAVVLQAEDVAADPCAAEGAVAGEQCECEPAGSFIASSGPVTVDVATGTLVQSTGPGAAQQAAQAVAQRPSVASNTEDYFHVSIGMSAHYDVLTNLEEACGERVDATCETDAATPSVGLAVEASWGSTVYAGVSGLYSLPVQLAQTYPGGGTVAGDMSTWGLDVYGGVRRPVGPFWLRASAGWARLYNTIDMDGPAGSETRKHSGGRFRASASVSAPLSDGLNARIGYLFRSAFDGDADEAHSAQVAVFLTPAVFRKGLQ